MKQRNRTAFGDTSFAVDHQVLLQSDRILVWAEERDSNSRIAVDVLELLVKVKVAADDFITFDSNPDDRYLWTPITVQRRYMCKRPGGNEDLERILELS